MWRRSMVVRRLLAMFNEIRLYNGNNTYREKPLFHVEIIDSKSIIPTDPVDCPNGQEGLWHCCELYNARCGDTGGGLPLTPHSSMPQT